MRTKLGGCGCISIQGIHSNSKLNLAIMDNNNYQIFFPSSSSSSHNSLPPTLVGYQFKEEEEEEEEEEEVKESSVEKTSGSGNKSKKKKIRKGRFAFETRSQVDVLDDGYRWRKYGQKAVKNNKFPRSYYKCSHQGCKVKKQIQRLTNDEGVVLTTYEGVHSHPIENPGDNFQHIFNHIQIVPSSF